MGTQTAVIILNGKQHIAKPIRNVSRFHMRKLLARNLLTKMVSRLLMSSLLIDTWMGLISFIQFCPISILGMVGLNSIQSYHGIDAMP